MTSIFDNPERGRLIMQALQEIIAANDELTMANMVARLPSDFELIYPEISEALETLAGAPETQPSMPVAAALGDAPADALGDTASPQAVPEAAHITQQAAWAMVEAAHRRLGTARLAVQLAQRKHSDTKAALARCVMAWQQNADPGTPEERRARELRNHLAGEAEQRARRGYTPKMDTSKHSAFDPVSGRSGFKGNRRGALPSNFQHRNVNSITMFQGVTKPPGAKA